MLVRNMSQIVRGHELCLTLYIRIHMSCSINSTKIERVQNPGLYRAYMVKKDQMEQKNGAT